MLLMLCTVLLCQNDDKVKDALKKTRSGNAARKRLQLIYDLCKNKKCCEGGNIIDTRVDKENIVSKVIIHCYNLKSHMLLC